MFRITWHVEPECWDSWRNQMVQERPGSSFDRSGLAIAWSPFGTLNMVSDGQELFAKQSRYWWLLTRSESYRRNLGIEDLSLADEIPMPKFVLFTLVSLMIERVIEADLSEWDDNANSIRIGDDETPSSIEFQHRSGFVRIAFWDIIRELSPDGSLTVSCVESPISRPIVARRSDFITEARKFVGDFVECVRREVPEIQHWDTWEVFREFA